jgi:5-methylthioribose kinase
LKNVGKTFMKNYLHKVFKQKWETFSEKFYTKSE